MNGNKNDFFETPYRKEIQSWPSYTKLFGLNKKKIKELEGNDNDWLIKISKIVQPENEDGSIVIIDTIKDKSKIKEFIEQVVFITQKRWRNYLDSKNKEIFNEEPLIGIDFEDIEERKTVENIIDWMIEALRNKMPYDELAYWWNRGIKEEGEKYSGSLKDLKYSRKHDYDGSLRTLLKLLGLLSDIKDEIPSPDIKPTPAPTPTPTPDKVPDKEDGKTVSFSEYNKVKRELNEWTKRFPLPETPDTVKEKCNRLQRVIEYEKSKFSLKS